LSDLSSRESLQTKIAGLAGNAATAEADLEAATAIRTRDHADFEKSEMVLLEVIDTLGDRHHRQEDVRRGFNAAIVNGLGASARLSVSWCRLRRSFLLTPPN